MPSKKREWDGDACDAASAEVKKTHAVLARQITNEGSAEEHLESVIKAKELAVVKADEELLSARKATVKAFEKDSKTLSKAIEACASEEKSD